MKVRLIVAAVIAVVNLILYPIMEHLAYMERGYNAIGGEEMLLIFGCIFIPMILILSVLEKQAHKRSDEAEQWEVEQ